MVVFKIQEMGPFLAGGFFRSIAGRVTDGDRENLGTLFVEWCPDVFSVEAVVDRYFSMDSMGEFASILQIP